MEGGQVRAAVTGARREGKRGIAAALPAWALILGTAVRLSYVLASDFPLNDGGLFLVMTQELRQSHYALPWFVAYNGLSIPYAYPPLGFYLTGLVADLGQWSLLEILRFVPLVLSVLTIIAFHRLARRALRSEMQTGMAVLAFALIPRSFTWQIMGGGITRSLGLLLATMAIGEAWALYADLDNRRLLPALIYMGGAALSHPEMAIFAALTAVLLFLAYGRSRQGIIFTALLALGSLFVAAPWWVTVLVRHGAAPFIAASQHGAPAFHGLVDLLVFRMSGEILFPVVGILAVLGILVCLVQKRWLLPSWLAVLLLLQPRSAHQMVAAPLALLAAMGLGDGLSHILCGEAPSCQEAGGATSARQANRGAGPGFVGAVAVSALLALLLSSLIGPRSYLQGLDQQDREAMSWIADNTPDSARFLVLSDESAWGRDRWAEWFPVLAQRTSVATVQGREWLPGFGSAVATYEELHREGCQGPDILARWCAETGLTFDYIYVPIQSMSGSAEETACRRAMVQHLYGCNDQYHLVYESPGALVYAVSQTESGRSPEQGLLQ